MLAWSVCRCPHDHNASKAATKYSAIAGTSPASMPCSWVNANRVAPCGNGAMITMAVAITTSTKPTARPAGRRVLRWVARLVTLAGYSSGPLGNRAVRHQAAPAASRGDQPFQPNRAIIAGRGTRPKYGRRGMDTAPDRAANRRARLRSGGGPQGQPSRRNIRLRPSEEANT